MRRQFPDKLAGLRSNMSQGVLKYLFPLFFLLLLLRAPSALANDACNPVILPLETETTVSKILSELAEKYNFSLSFPRSLDKPVRVDESMGMKQLIKWLTRDMNTVLRHKNVVGCIEPKLTELTVMPVGDETEFIRVAEKTVPQPEEYIYIDNMEHYVTEVLMNGRKAEACKMTPEQKSEFKSVKKRLRSELKSEIKQNRSKGKKKKTKSQSELSDKTRRAEVAESVK